MDIPISLKNSGVRQRKKRIWEISRTAFPSATSSADSPKFSSFFALRRHSSGLRVSTHFHFFPHPHVLYQ